MTTLTTVLNTAKQTVKNFKPLGQSLKHLYYSLPPEMRESMGVEDNRTETELSLKPYIRPDSDFFFIKIGANDGVMGDPFGHWVRQYNWTGIMVEPVDYLFDRLVANYSRCTNLQFEKSAIADCEGRKTFYFIREPKVGEVLPEWCQGINSFNLDVLLMHEDGLPNLKDYLCEQHIPCITFTQLLSKYQVQKVDLLHIDTEGYDFEILKTIDFSILKPALILYETKHLSPSDHTASQVLLQDQGYEIQPVGADSLAILS